jgi:ketosteroid isomerase-like protein
MDARRRDLLTAGATLVAATAAGVGAAVAPAVAEKPRRGANVAADAEVAALAAAFARLSQTLNSGDAAGFLSMFDARAICIDEDAPFRMDKAGFVEHLGFHDSTTWENFAWVPRESRHLVRGDSGFTAGAVTFRGKPRDAGFRQRHMLITMAWHREAGAWRIVSFHQTPVWGHVDGASPGTGG